MKFLEGKSSREKYLLLGLILALIFGSYLSLRVKSLNADIQKTEARIKKENKTYQRLMKLTGDARPSRQIRKEIDSLNKKLEKERQNLEGLDFSFVNLGDQEALHALIADITLAAERHQLQILGKQNEVTDLISLVGTSPGATVSSSVSRNNRNRKNNTAGIPAGSGTLKRHVFKLKLRGSFRSTYDFIHSLKKLDNGVLIARLNLTAEDLNTYNGRRLITTDLTLAI